MHIRTSGKLLLAACVSVVLAPAAAWASKVIGSSSARGDYAVTIASGTATSPKKLRVKITSSPAQRVTGNWTMVCSKGMSASSKSGDFSGRGTFYRRMRMPFSGASSCTVSASGQLDGSGRIRVTLLKN